MAAACNSTKFMVLMILCLQNTFYTVLRRYSQGILKETYSKYECLMFAEVIKVVFSAFMIRGSIQESASTIARLKHVTKRSGKMLFLALIYGLMNILSFVALRNIGAGIFTIFAQCKILTTATFSAIILRRTYSWARWRALIGLSLGVLLFSEPVWNGNSSNSREEGAKPMLGTIAVLIEVTLSGFASIYFEKVVKNDPEKMSIWERNFQLAMWSFPIYIAFIISDRGGEAGYFGGWSVVTFVLSSLGAAGGLLVALSIKHGDSILKTLATTGAIVLSSILDHFLLFGPLTPVMVISGVQVVIAICNYTFDSTPVETVPPLVLIPSKSDEVVADDEEMDPLVDQESGLSSDAEEINTDVKGKRAAKQG
eukprot:CAMPEP_0113525240 /NCGR_PEP_ID=MMETSP0015_2-20120614/48_1 /TAXON_ID=2838 /ORGANISM="Odontella" /LENGTH=367 /DNA_ID=CAMNT_0000423377 /DNA_START=304 /DNA_END=1407 /DNA_ORIENTATION=+ /assembly_acc=CAM_ASM_000160